MSIERIGAPRPVFNEQIRQLFNRAIAHETDTDAALAEMNEILAKHLLHCNALDLFSAMRIVQISYHNEIAELLRGLDVLGEDA